MSHRLLASVWDGLQNRNDVVNILQEIIGQHTLELLHTKTFNAESLRPVLWIKTIFDLQRTYLQATGGAHDCPVPGLLPTELVFSSLMYLLHVKSKLFPPDQPADEGRNTQRLLLVHTLLSGTRLLLLRNEQLALEKLKRLERAMEAVWYEHKDLPEREHFIIFELLPEALDTESPTENQAGDDYAATLRQFGVPPFQEGLYPLCVRPIKLCSLTFSNISQGSPDWLSWYWVLFDALWASESALVQAHVDQYNEPSSPVSPNTQNPNVITQLQNARRNIIAAVFRAPKPSEVLPGACILESLNATVLGWHEEAEPYRQQVSEKQILEFNFALHSFVAWMSERNTRAQQLNLCPKCGPLTQQQSARTVHRSEPLNSPTSPSQDLLETPSSSDAASLSQTTNTSESLSSTTAGISLPTLTSGDTDQSTVISRETLSRSRSDETSSSKETKDSWNVRALTIRRALKPSKEKLAKEETCRPSSFCFSSSGRSLIIWGGNSCGFMRIGLSPTNAGVVDGAAKWELDCIKAVACGDERCVAIASHQERFVLVSFYGRHPLPEAQVDLDIPLRHYTDSCIVVSKNDYLVALAVNDSVHLYRLSRGNITRVVITDQTHFYQHLASQRRFSDGTSPQALSSREDAQEAQNESTVVERRISFSPSSEKLIICTQLSDHYCYIDVYNCESDPCITITRNPHSFKLPPWTTNDGGFTNIFYDDIHHLALLTAFISKGYQSLICMDTNEVLEAGSFFSKVVHAAQSPSGSTFIIANGMSEIIHLNVKPNRTLSPRKLKKAGAKISSSAFRPNNMVLSMPDEGTVFAFWVKDLKFILRTMKIAEGESYTDLDLRPHVDRLHSDRSPPIILSNRVIAPTTLYGEPAMLHNESVVRMLHGDHIVELPTNHPREKVKQRLV
ncbi:hypothetical protein EJ08DRAFT_3976 [Tothia fuscella]|uniref:Uncharacterized protein n=1 Tax=Tothia fuscella TaxID=1048955 RepID=A0A9P4P4Y2_9PEZI|nr:hypothetical protein EJ08DRAFT_3976 [Tothia fuscella]